MHAAASELLNFIVMIFHEILCSMYIHLVFFFIDLATKKLAGLRG